MANFLETLTCKDFPRPSRDNGRVIVVDANDKAKDAMLLLMKVSHSKCSPCPLTFCGYTAVFYKTAHMKAQNLKAVLYLFLSYPEHNPLFQDYNNQTGNGIIQQ